MIRQTCGKLRSIALVLASVVACTACGDGEGRKPGPQLLVAKKSSSAEDERINKLMNLRVYLPSKQRYDDLVNGSGLFSPLGADWTPGCSTSGSDDWMRSDHSLRFSLLITQVAQSLVPIESPMGYIIPPQEDSVRVALLYSARRSARNALAWSLDLFGDSPRPQNDNFGEWFDRLNYSCGNHATRAAEAVKNIREALSLYRNATNEAARLTAAVGDSLRVQAASEEEGKILQFSAEEFSRSAAGHILSGGRAGWQGSEQATPLCPSRALAPTAQRALALLRAAAPDPNFILDDAVSIADFLNSSAAGGSVRLRLANYFGRHEEIALSAKPLHEIFNLSLDDFILARQYLAREIVAFGRSRTAKLPADPAMGSISRFAGVANPPRALEPIVSSAKLLIPDKANTAVDWTIRLEPSAASSDESNPNFVEDLTRWTEDEPLDQFELLAAIELNRIIGRLVEKRAEWLDDPQGNHIGNNYQTEVLDPISAEVSSILDRTWGVVSFQRTDTNEVYIQMARAAGKSLYGRFWVVGEDGLRCAIDGNIEGAPCALSDPSLRPVPETVPNVDGEWQELFPIQTHLKFSIPSSDEKYVRFYLIEPTDQGNRAVFGFSVLTAGQDLESVEMVRQVRLVQPEIIEQAAKYVSIDERWCGETEYDCRGFKTGSRLPLENELSEDDSGVESSWKHYVTLAQQAASEAALRGKESFDAGLEIERRKELVWENHEIRARAAVDAIQSACGTAADPRKILDVLLSAGTTTPPSVVTNCTQHTDCNAVGSNDYECFGGACVVNVAEFIKSNAGDDADLRRIAECAAESNVVDFVSPGSVPMCLWTGASADEVCPDARMDSAPCPVRAELTPASDGTATYSCDSIVLPPGYVRSTTNVIMLDSGNSEVGRPNKLLGYFDNSDPSPTNVQKVCADFRHLRTLTKGGGNLLANAAEINRLQNEIKNSQLFYPSFMWETLETPNGFGWRYLPNTNVELLLGTRTVYSTGRIGLEGEAPNPKWPCGTDGVAPDCSTLANNQGMFCDVYDCSNPVERENAIDRLTSAAKLLNRLVEDPKKIGHMESVWPGRNEFSCANSDRTISFYNRPGMAPITEEMCGKPGEFSPFRIWRIVTSNATDGRIWWDKDSISFVGAPPPNFEVRTEAATGHKYWWIGDGSYIGTHKVERPNPEVDFNEFDDQFCRRFLNGLSHQPNYPVEACSGQGLGKQQQRGFDTLVGFPPGDYAWDAMELYCQVKANGVPGCDPSNPPTVAGVSDLPAVSRYMQCVGDSISRQAGSTVFSRLPQRAVDALRKETALGAFPAVGGEYASAIAQLRGAMVDLSDMPGAIATEIRQISYDVDAIRATLEGNSLDKELLDIQFTRTMYEALKTCATGAMNLVSGDVMSFASGCASSLAEIGFASQISKIQERKVELKQISDIAQFQSMISQRARTLETYASRINQAIERLDSQLAIVEGLRLKARRAMSEAIWSATYKAPNSDAIDNSLHWRYTDARKTYEDATENALRYAVIARKAVEQRLGLRLKDLTEEMPLVKAPATWVDDICRAKGITFEEIKSTAAAESDKAALESIPGSDRLLGTFVGDYVNKLANVVESYSMSFPFHEGVDEAVVSLRNDLKKTRAPCAKPSPNLVPDSEGISALHGSTKESRGWFLQGCPKTAEGGLLNCVPLSDDVLLTGVDALDIEYAQAFRLDFSWTAITAAGFSPTGYTPQLATAVVLNPGTYYLSHIGFKTACMAKLGVSDENGGPIAMEAGPASELPVDRYNATLQRVISRFTITERGKYYVTIGEAEAGVCAAQTTAEGRTARIAAVMLQQANEELNGSWGRVVRYVTSDQDGTVINATCEDTTGAYFRKNAWTRSSLRLCSDGYASSCDERVGTLQWFREVRFRLDDATVEAGEAFHAAGFAMGNYNYRIEKLGVNFVGTGIRACDMSANPTGCYGSGYVQYTLQHLGPFFTRNHFGADVESLIFDGRIEHARGLATERYLTNPLSSADRGLLEPYVREEFQGRPLSGEYVLRIWENPEVNMERIQDIQLYLKYRYWTRQD